MQISGTTRVVGIFGDPVAHSLSPLMHNAALAALGIDAVYVPFHVPAGRLPVALDGVRALGLLGVNLTIPHKEAACALVDELDPLAALSGAVNTVVQRDGRLVGHNTDGRGLLAALHEELGCGVEGKRVLLLGAGGAARAAAAAVLGAGAAWLGVANRTPARAVELASGLAPAFPRVPLVPLALGAALAVELEGRVDLLINCSAAGLGGSELPCPVLGCLAAGGKVYDMVYGATSTPLVRAARAAGIPAADGLGMLAGQGAVAFRLWFGADPPAGLLRATLAGLSGRK